ncbi:Uncharacterised protein [Mycobacteroides abscessus]|nr:Uncharacterised protein [Mycobacteroides abscessus]
MGVAAGVFVLIVLIILGVTIVLKSVALFRKPRPR